MVWRERTLPRGPGEGPRVPGPPWRRLGRGLGLWALLAGAALLGGCQNIQASFDALRALLPDSSTAGVAGSAEPGDKGRAAGRGPSAGREIPAARGAILPSGEGLPADALGDDPSVAIQTGAFAAGETVGAILSANGLSRGGIREALAASRPVHPLSRVRAGLRYEVAAAGGRLRRFLVHLDEDRRLRVYRTRRGGLRARVETIPYEVEVVRLRGKVKDSLFGAVNRAGGSPAMAVSLSDIFGYTIDFLKDLNEGDRIEALVERRFLGGREAGFGRILAAELIVGGKKHAAIYFAPEGPAGEGDYYTPTGESLRRTFLRSPLRYTRISSKFSRRRYHPILKRYRPHFGVDYAAPPGTPVRAVADGVVTWAGWRGQAGKMVKLMHGGGYRTAYMHLSRFGRGIRRGRKVRQGVVVGYVGATGLATGPHLDYRITYRGRPLDPLRVKLPSGRALAAPLRARFLRLVGRRRAQFARAPVLGRDAEVAAVGRARPLF